MMKRICSYNTRICLISPTISERPVYTLVVILSTAIYSNSKRQAKKKKRFRAVRTVTSMYRHFFLFLFLHPSNLLSPHLSLPRLFCLPACHQVSFSSHFPVSPVSPPLLKIKSEFLLSTVPYALPKEDISKSTRVLPNLTIIQAP